MKKFVCESCSNDSYDKKLYYDIKRLSIKNLIKHYIKLIMGKKEFVLNKLFNKKYIYQCKSCKLGVIYDKPTQKELDKYYAQYYWNNYRETNFQLLPIDERAISQVQYISKNIRDYSFENILEFGSGHGKLSRSFNNQFSVKKFNFVEPDKNFYNYYKKELKNVFCTNHLVNVENESCNIILSSHSIEHISDINALFTLFFNKLKWGGM